MIDQMRSRCIDDISDIREMLANMNGEMGKIAALEADAIPEETTWYIYTQLRQLRDGLSIANSLIPVFVAQIQMVTKDDDS